MVLFTLCSYISLAAFIESHYYMSSKHANHCQKAYEFEGCWGPQESTIQLLDRLGLMQFDQSHSLDIDV